MNCHAQLNVFGSILPPHEDDRPFNATVFYCLAGVNSKYLRHEMCVCRQHAFHLKFVLFSNEEDNASHMCFLKYITAFCPLWFEFAHASTQMVLFLHGFFQVYIPNSSSYRLCQIPITHVKTLSTCCHQLICQSMNVAPIKYQNVVCIQTCLTQW